MKLYFATNNQHKLQEAKAILHEVGIDVLSLSDAGISLSVEETGDTFHDNAFLKAQALYEILQEPCFADDSGLEVFALHGEPGVRSSRYAGEEGNSDKNIIKLLEELKQVEDRRARFVTVVCLILDGVPYFFEGEVRGKIIRERRGTGGFGYDSVFVPEGYEKTFAEMTSEEKNKISHRRNALMLMKDFLLEKA